MIVIVQHDDKLVIIYESKLEGTNDQYERLDQAIRTGRFIRNSIIKAWMDGQVKSRNDAYAYCKVLSDSPEFPWANQLNSQARQAHAERAWASIDRFYSNCKKKIPGKKADAQPAVSRRDYAHQAGFPKFKKHQVRGTVEYKSTGWKLSEDRRYLSFTDKFNAGTFKLWGSRSLHYYQLNQIKRVRVVRRHDGYYAQFLIEHTRIEEKALTGKQIGLDVGLTHFYTDSAGNKIENPKFLRKDERKLKRLQRRLSKTQKKSKNRVKARNRLGRAHLKVSRRRNDWVCKQAQRVIQSSDLVAIENLKVRNMVSQRVGRVPRLEATGEPVRVKNHHLAKSINDAAWYKFREWLEYFGVVYGVPVVAVAPQMTSQNCSKCGKKVQKSLSTRTHRCSHCGYVADRDENAAINILKSALRNLATTLGHSEREVSGENDLCWNGETQSSKPTRRKRKSQE